MTVINTFFATSAFDMSALASLTVLSNGSIVAPNGSIQGTGSSQSVSIAGYVEISFMQLGGNNFINLSRSGTYYSHDGTGLALGVSEIGVISGGSTLNNEGSIFAANAAIRMSGDGNVVVNNGSINSFSFAVSMFDSANSHVSNTGRILSSIGTAVELRGANGSLENSGSIFSRAGAAVVATGSGATVNNSGTISIGAVSESSAIYMLGARNTVTNDGTILANTDLRFGNVGFGIRFDGVDAAIHNSGIIRATSMGIAGTGFGGVITNTGEITSSYATAIGLTASASSARTTIYNSGTLTGVVSAITGINVVEAVYNTGTINGNVLLLGGDDIFDGRGGILRGLVNGGAGGDSYYVDRHIGIVEAALDLGLDQVFTEINFKLAAGVENLTLLEADDINGSGNSSSNLITGNAGNNVLAGIAGNDTLSGGEGDDRLIGGTGNDSQIGSDGDDVLRGNDGADTMNGGEGDDLLVGGGGQDSMTGGGGIDRFVFQRLNQSGATTVNPDRITDFAIGTDVIDLSAIDARAANATPDDSFTFLGTAAFSGAGAQANYVIDVANNVTFIQLEVNGDLVADCVIRLSGQLTLTAADFIL